jgi:two-component system sensor histidine kinase KdpD
LHLLVVHLRSSFALDSVAILHRTADGWVCDAEAGLDAPHRPADADLVDELAPDAVLALRGRDLTADDRRVLSAFGAHSRAFERCSSTAAIRGRWSRPMSCAPCCCRRCRTTSARRWPRQGVGVELRQDDVEWTDDEPPDLVREEQTDRLTTSGTCRHEVAGRRAEPQFRAVALDEVVPAHAGRGWRRDRRRASERCRGASGIRLVRTSGANLLENAVNERRRAGHVLAVNGASRCTSSTAVPAFRAASACLRQFQRSKTRERTGSVKLAVARGIRRGDDGELTDDTPGADSAIVTLPTAP